jgi:hypothetical protein
MKEKNIVVQLKATRFSLHPHYIMQSDMLYHFAKYFYEFVSVNDFQLEVYIIMTFN